MDKPKTRQRPQDPERSQGAHLNNCSGSHASFGGVADCTQPLVLRPFRKQPLVAELGMFAWAADCLKLGTEIFICLFIYQ